MLFILRNASVRSPLLRRLLRHFYVATNAHLTIDIDSSLPDGDIAQLINLKLNEALMMCIILLMMVKKIH
uniref:Uncharacterized protein n=1 Tax=Amphimedon queenslandica TaxID=400682 RepID=A0A1X7VU50_AMPQE